MGDEQYSLDDVAWTPARRDFHIALLFSFVPLLSLPVSWTLALVRAAKRREWQRGEAGWVRALFALAVLDTLLGVALVGGMGRIGVALQARSHALTQPKIGVHLDAAADGSGCKLGKTLPGSPAARAGLQPGDRVLAIDTAKIADCGALRRAVRETKPGTARTFRLVRAGRSRSRSITPVSSSHLRGQRSPAGLFEAEGPCENGSGIDGGTYRAGGVLGALLLIALIGWRRGAARPFTVYALLAAALLGGYVLTPVGLNRGICALLGGGSLGALLLALIVGPGIAIGLVAPLLGRLRRAGCFGDATAATAAIAVSRGLAFGLGVGYAFAGIWRLRIGGLLVESIWPGAGAQDPAFINLLSQATATPAALALFALAAVLIGPIAEEVLIRGLLLPWLAGWLDERLALGLSALAFALLHPQYGSSDLLVIAWLGWVLGWARLRSGSLLPAIALHAAINGLGVALAASLR